jgi:FkbM family methyltransferase
MGSRIGAKLGRMLQVVKGDWPVPKTAQERAEISSLSGVWIDVGAYLGTETFPAAKENPSLHVYAFEPNLRLAAQYWGLFPNITVLPMAVCENDGFSDFYINDNVGSSSILPHNAEGVRNWIGGYLFKVASKVPVPTVRLDTFMAWAGISKVEYLKIDAQGADFSVVRSAGERVRDIKKIKLEVAVTAISPYEGAARRIDVVNYLESFGFVLADVQRQFYDQEENLTFVYGSV